MAEQTDQQVEQIAQALTFRIPNANEPGYLKRRRQSFILVETLQRGFRDLAELDAVIDFLLNHVVTPTDRDEARALIENLSVDGYLAAIRNLGGAREAEEGEPPLPSSAS